MKKYYFIAAMATGIIFFTACGNDNAAGNTTADSSATTIPTPGNSSATNPSLADTAFSKNYSDTTRMKKDSVKIRQ